MNNKKTAITRKMQFKLIWDCTVTIETDNIDELVTALTDPEVPAANRIDVYYKDRVVGSICPRNRREYCFVWLNRSTGAYPDTLLDFFDPDNFWPVFYAETFITSHPYLEVL